MAKNQIFVWSKALLPCNNIHSMPANASKGFQNLLILQRITNIKVILKHGQTIMVDWGPQKYFKLMSDSLHSENNR